MAVDLDALRALGLPRGFPFRIQQLEKNKQSAMPVRGTFRVDSPQLWCIAKTTFYVAGTGIAWAILYLNSRIALLPMQFFNETSSHKMLVSFGMFTLSEKEIQSPIAYELITASSSDSNDFHDITIFELIP